MTTVIINPGSGPVANANAATAYENMEALMKDVGVPGAEYRRDPEANDGEDGRFSFLVKFPQNPEEVSVDMPGIPLDDVRYLGTEGQNIWHFPRLYVDGSSWVWKFAVSQLNDRALDGDDDE